MVDKFRMCYVIEFGTLSGMFNSYEAAEIEAERLAKLPENLGHEVIILEAMYSYCVPELSVKKTIIN